MNLFVYGSLSFTEIMSALLDRPVAGVPGVISGFERLGVKGHVFPGLVPGDGDIDGVLHSDLTDEEFKLLNAFESDFYEQVIVPVMLEDGRVMDAPVYVVPEKNRKKLLKDEWDREEFRRNHLEKYVGWVTDFRREFLAQNSRYKNQF